MYTTRRQRLHTRRRVDVWWCGRQPFRSNSRSRAFLRRQSRLFSLRAVLFLSFTSRTLLSSATSSWISSSLVSMSVIISPSVRTGSSSLSDSSSVWSRSLTAEAGSSKGCLRGPGRFPPFAPPERLRNSRLMAAAVMTRGDWGAELFEIVAMFLEPDSSFRTMKEDQFVCGVKSEFTCFYAGVFSPEHPVVRSYFCDAMLVSKLAKGLWLWLPSWNLAIFHLITYSRLEHSPQAAVSKRMDLRG